MLQLKRNSYDMHCLIDLPSPCLDDIDKSTEGMACRVCNTDRVQCDRLILVDKPNEISGGKYPDR